MNAAFDRTPETTDYDVARAVDALREVDSWAIPRRLDRPGSRWDPRTGFERLSEAVPVGFFPPSR